MNAPAEEHRRVTLTLDLDYDGLAYIHAADALLHLIGWFEHEGIHLDANLHIPGRGNLAAPTRHPD